MTLPHPKAINILFDDGGLGDNIARIPVLNYIYQNYPNTYISVFIHDYFVPVIKNYIGAKKDRIYIYKWSERHKYYDPTVPTKSFQRGAYSNLSMQMTEHSFAITCNTVPSSEWMNYPKLELSAVDISGFALPEKYIVVTSAFTAAVREFLPEYINKVVSELKSRGENIVFLGQKITQTGTDHVIEGNLSEAIDFSQGVNLIDRTSLLQAAKIMGNAKCVIGLDNGLLHLAACTDVPVVSGFTTVKPEHREAFRHNTKGWNWFSVVPPESLSCRFCQSKCVFTAGVDFRFCPLNTYDCVKQLSAELYLEQIEKALK